MSHVSTALLRTLADRAAARHPSLTAATWADGGGCATYHRTDPDRNRVSTAVTYGGASFGFRRLLLGQLP